MEKIYKGLVVIGLILSLFVLVNVLSYNYAFKANCKDYLKLAGDAPNIELADQYLTKALGYIESKGLVSGNSAFFFNPPDSDLSIWYRQLKGAKETLTTLIDKKVKTQEVNQLECDNALMKLREVVLDQGKDGTVVTYPNNIAWYPYQWLVLIGLIVAIGILAVGAIWWGIDVS